MKKRNVLQVPKLGIEVEIERNYEGLSFESIMALPEVQEKMNNGWRLLSLNEVVFLANDSKYSKILQMDGSSTEGDFFIEQPFELNKKNGHVAELTVISDEIGLDCGGYYSGSDSRCGGAFCSGTAEVINRF